MTLKLTQIIELYNALSNLDGYSKVIKKGDQEAIVQIPYLFSGKTRWNITKNLDVLESHTKRYTKVRDDLIRQYSNGEETIDQKTNPTGWKAFNDENIKLGEEELDCAGLLKLNVDEFLKDENPVPASILKALDVVLVNSSAEQSKST